MGTLLLSQLPPQLLRKSSLSNLPLLLPSTPSKDLRPRLLLLLSPSTSLDSLKVKLTLGCAKLPLCPHLTLSSELPWSRVTPPLLLPHQNLLVIPLSGAHSSLLSS